MTGGLIGFVRDGSDITVANCNVASGNITGTGGDNFGGIIGATYNAFSVSIYDCCITDVTIEGSYAGGIAGNGQRANLYNCYFAGTLVPLEGPWGTYYGGITAYGMYYAVSCYSNQENSSADAYGGTYYAEEYLKSADFAELLNSNTYSDSIEWRYFPGKNGGYPFVTKKISIDDLLNVEGGTLEFVTDGDYPFEITTNPGNEIELVCASTNMGIDYSVSFIQTSVTGPGAITFDWMVSGTYYYDLLSVCLDIEDIFDFYPRSDASEWISGETGWISSSIGIPEGTHTITWIYSKYDYVDCYNDRGYLKNVAFVTGERNITVGYNSNWGTVEIESDDTVIGTTSGQASMGAVVELSAIPEDRYIFVCWKSPDGKIIFDTNYSFAMGAYDVYFEAVFAKALNIDISWYKNPPEGANGSSEDTPYIIDSVESLAGLAALVNDTTNDPEITDVVDFYGEYIKLNADIDLSDYYWTPIGIYNSFKGSFDGNGKTISGLAFDGAETYDVGLFGLVEEGSVKNLNVIMSAALDYEKRIGGIIGFIDNGSITNCTSNAGISAGDECQIGGIVGASVNSIIENCTSVVDIVSGSERAIGGITGSCYFSSVQNCTSSGIISGKVWCSSGGIAGDSYNAEFNFCISSCSITSGFGTLNGGIAGASYLGAFNNCLNSGDILASAESLIGGIAGECYNSNACAYYAQDNNINLNLEPFGENSFNRDNIINYCYPVDPAIFKTGEAAWMLNAIIEFYNNYPVEDGFGDAWTQGENYPVFANGDAIRRITISDGSIKLYQFAKQNEQVTIAVYGYEIVNITSDDVEKITDGSFIMPPYDVLVYASIYKWLTYDSEDQTVAITLPLSLTTEAIIASYNDNRIIDIIKVPVDITAHTPCVADISELDIGEANKIKVILLENLSSIRPLFNSLEESICTE